MTYDEQNDRKYAGALLIKIDIGVHERMHTYGVSMMIINEYIYIVYVCVFKYVLVYNPFGTNCLCVR